ncbi:helix-turn-helix domain-containing protein [Streptomyces sp. NPDC057011]|uniref:helix-turn-helix domain-containing protein n=1 Tax=unclassified Streptomyces TaxID=2593676 RepID=UPI003639BF37
MESTATAHLAAQVGARVRALRTERGVSLSELARRSRIGKGTLSELESGRRNPTLETLYALTTALEVPLSTALHTTGLPAEISGAAVDAVLTERFEDASVVTETYRVRIRAGSAQESAAHTPGTTEHIVVLAGTARVGPLHSPALSVGPGEHATWAADVPHLYEAPAGDVEALLVVRYPRPGRKVTGPPEHGRKSL